jgi:glycosyltransferase involved in cell wall biosynthesis
MVRVGVLVQSNSRLGWYVGSHYVAVRPCRVLPLRWEADPRGTLLAIRFCGYVSDFVLKVLRRMAITTVGKRRGGSPLRVIISVNSAWNIANFRAGLIRAMKADGHDVIAVAPSDGYAGQLVNMGCRFIPFPMDNKGTNPFADAGLLLRYFRLFWSEQPDVFLGYTIKPNIYGSLAAAACCIPVINNVSGLGTSFIRNNWLTWVVKALYRLAFARSHTVFFQNEDDRQLFLQHALVAVKRTALLPGSGINLDGFKPIATAEPQRAKGFRFLLIARLLYDKGVGEYAKAARILKAKRPEVACGLLGFLDVENRTAVTRDDLDRWVRDGVIEYFGATDDVRPHIAEADCIVLPSYREGTPRTLLEGAAMGKPLIATDVPGCREVVEHGRNGLLCREKDADDLAHKMIEMIDMSASERQAMGAAGRVKMEREFDERLVVRAYLKSLASILEPASSGLEKVRSAVKKRIVYICDWLPPDFGAVGQYALLSARQLARNGWVVTLVGLTSGDSSCGPVERVGAGTLEVIKVHRFTYQKQKLGFRAMWTVVSNLLLLRAAFQAMRLADTVLFTGSPPLMVHFIAPLNLLLKKELIYRITDFHPECLIAENGRRGFFLNLLLRLTFFWRRRIDAYEVLGVDQARRLGAIGIERRRIRLKPNPSPATFAKDMAPMPVPTQFRDQCGVILYSGNWGVAHDEETFIEAYTRYRYQSKHGLAFWLNAVGAKADRVEREIRLRGVPIYRSSLVPLQELPRLLLAAHVHLITLRDPFVGFVVPSKVHACIESGKRIIFVGSESSDVHCLASCALPSPRYSRVDVGDIDGLVDLLVTTERAVRKERGRETAMQS